MRKGPIGSLVVVVALALASPLAAATHYVDCANGDDAAAGVHPDRAWASLDRLNAIALEPGDTILLRRGTRCRGSLRPSGSGVEGAPITLDAYGIGVPPVIDAADAPAAIELFNQQYWHLRNVETVGGNPYGIHVSGNLPGVLRHFRIVDVIVHGVRGTVTNKESGLIVVSPGAAATTFEDVIIDGALAYDSTQWAGILVGGDDFGGTPTSPRSRNVTVRNSTVHDVHGDGIVLYQVNQGVIETSVVHDTGLNPSPAVGTPNGIWTWMCGDCVVQFNEGYRTGSPGVDGGVFDIDYGCSNNVVQYNYAHDADAYCVAVFGAYWTTTDSVIRYNVCANNARDASKAWQGDIYVLTWAGGALDGLEIYNNTIVWSPAVEAYAVNLKGARLIGSGPRRFLNNLIFSDVPQLIDASSAAGMQIDHNLYWHAGTAAPLWRLDAVESTLTDWRFGGHDANGRYADPRLADPRREHSAGPTPAFAPSAGSPAIDAGAELGAMGAHDFAGREIPHGRAHDVGALEWRARSTPGNSGWFRKSPRHLRQQR